MNYENIDILVGNNILINNSLYKLWLNGFTS